MPLTDVELCATALVKLGAQPITSFDDAGAEAAIARRLYPVARDALLGSFPWRFAATTAQLQALPGTPAADFGFAVRLPTDCLRVVSAGVGRASQGLTYRIEGDRLLAGYAPVTVAYQRRVDEADFPPFFVQALVCRLAAELCIPITEQSGRAQDLYRIAEAELRVARLLDSQQGTPRRIEDFTLIGARFA